MPDSLSRGKQMINKTSALSEAISLTDEILLLLDEENFDAVGTLDARRQSLIEKAFSGSIEDIDQIKARHLQNLNDQVVVRLQQFRSAVIEQQAKLRQSSKAARAYQSNR